MPYNEPDPDTEMICFGIIFALIIAAAITAAWLVVFLLIEHIMQT